MYTTQEADVVKGISRLPLTFSRLKEEDLVKFDQLVGDQTHSQDKQFELGGIPMVSSVGSTDMLNQAFSSLFLIKSEISPTRVRSRSASPCSKSDDGLNDNEIATGKMPTFG